MADDTKTASTPDLPARLRRSAALNRRHGSHLHADFLDEVALTLEDLIPATDWTPADPRLPANPWLDDQLCDTLMEVANDYSHQPIEPDSDADLMLRALAVIRWQASEIARLRDACREDRE